MNTCIKELSTNCFEYGLGVKNTTKLDGDCIFQSVCDLGYCGDKQKLRTAVAVMLYEYRNYKGYFESQPSFTPKELFNTFSQDNNIKVIDDVRLKIIDYTYEVMCRDLSCESAWDRMYVEFVFITLSFMFDAEIRIYQDDTVAREEKETKKAKEISYKTNDKKKYKNIIRIGLLNNYHYVPLFPINKSTYNIDDAPLYKLKMIKSVSHVQKDNQEDILEHNFLLGNDLEDPLLEIINV